MAKTLPRLSRKYLDQPQFITPSKFEEIAEVLDSKDRSYFKSAYNAAIENDFEFEKTQCAIFEDYYLRKGSGEKPQYGVLDVNGPITYKATGWEMLCGEGTNYTSLVEQMEGYVSDGLKEVYMVVDSGGGEAAGCFEASRTLRNLADENGIKLIGYVEGSSGSAAYGLSCACHELIANPSSEVGSVGVVVSLMNNSEQMKKEGLKRSFITAGASKVPFDAEGEFKDEFLADLQDKVDVLYEQFTGHVANYRTGMTQDQVKATEAKMFQSDKALELGLIDKVMELRDFKKEYLSGYTLVSVQNNKPKETLMSDQPATPELSAEDIAAMQTQLAQMGDLQAQLATFQAKEVEAEKASLSTKLESKPFLADCKENLVDFFMNADIDADIKSLMNNVIDSASAEMSTINENHLTELSDVKAEAKGKVEAAEKLATDAEAKVEDAETKAEAVKEEFGTQEQLSDEAVPSVEKVSMAEQLKANMAKVKASQNK